MVTVHRVNCEQIPSPKFQAPSPKEPDKYLDFALNLGLVPSTRDGTWVLLM